MFLSHLKPCKKSEKIELKAKESKGNNSYDLYIPREIKSFNENINGTLKFVEKQKISKTYIHNYPVLKYFTDRHDKNYYDNDNIKTILYELNICKAKLEHDHIKNNISDNAYDIINDIFLSIEHYFNIIKVENFNMS